MAVEKGTRPGTREGDRIPGWNYVKGRHPKYAGICASDREQRRWEENLNAAAEALELAALRCRVAALMTHGGHVEAGAAARAGVAVDADPEAVLALCVRGLPTDLPDKAVVKKK
jgi:hypothetical protein